VTGDGVGRTAGTRQLTLGPEPVNVPGPVHSNVREPTGVSLSVTVADNVTVSSMSAKPEGWLFREPMLLMLFTTGGWLAPDGATRLKRPVRIAVAPPEVTLTSTGPGLGSGAVVAEMTVEPRTLTSVAGRPPIMTVASAAKPVPLIVTGVPPVVLPACGVMAATESLVGAGPTGEELEQDPSSHPAASKKGVREIQ